MNLNGALKDGIVVALQNHECKLYDLAFVNEGGMKILRVMITKENGGVDLDTCANVSEEISTLLDQYDEETSEYYLEVCSAGAERQLRSNEEIQDAVGKYVFMKLNKPFKKMDEIKGDLLSFENDTLEVSYMDKAVKRKAEINVNDISLIRLAVRI